MLGFVNICEESGSLEQFNSAAIAAYRKFTIEQNEHSEELIYLECKIAAYRLEPDIIRENLNCRSDKQLIEMECKASNNGRADRRL